MRKILAILVFLFAGDAIAQTLQWAIAPLDDRGDPIRTGFAALQNPKHVAALDAAGNLFIAGYSLAPGSFPEADRELLGKYSSDTGAAQWRLIGTAQSAFSSVAVDAAGDAFVVGFFGSGGIEHQYVARISGVSGTIVWEARGVPGETSENFGVDIVLDTAGNPIVIGAHAGRAVVTKYAANTGAVLWSVIPGPDVPNLQHPFGLESDRDGNVVGITYFGDVPLNNTGSLLFKLDGASGARIWATPLAYKANASPAEIQAFALDGLGKPTLVGKDVVKFSHLDGTLNWRRTLSGDGSASFAYGVTTASNGDILVTGTVGVQSEQVVTARFASASGATVWSAPLAGTDPAHANQIGKSITVDASGNVRVAAQAFFAGGANYELATLHYAGITGSVLGAARYAGGTGAGTATANLELAAGDAAYTIGSFARSTGVFPTALKYTGLAAANPPRLGNISTRGQVLTGDDVLIGGFIIGGSAPKSVMVVAYGPSLAAAGVANPLMNPTMTLVRSADQAVIGANDDWQGAANASEIRSSGLAPADPHESAILMTLAPGAYTAVVSGAGGTTGVGIVAVYEVDRPDVPLVNISTRGKVLTGEDVLIAGLIVQGDAPRTVVITAAGPSLASAGVAGSLANPTMMLVRSSDQTVIATNDDWQTAPNADAIRAAGFAPADPREPAIMMTLPPGAYTAIVSGAGGTTGVSVVGVFAAQ